MIIKYNWQLYLPCEDASNLIRAKEILEDVEVLDCASISRNGVIFYPFCFGRPVSQVRKAIQILSDLADDMEKGGYR